MRACVRKGDIEIVPENMGDVEMLRMKSNPIECFLEICTERRYTCKCEQTETSKQHFEYFMRTYGHR